jgi:hypothetical protein
MAVLTPLYLEKKGYTAKDDRLALPNGEGIMTLGSLAVTASPGGGMASLVAAGRAMIRGDFIADQGVYEFTNGSPVVVNHSAADVTNPRIDQVVARIYDSVDGGSSQDLGALEVLTGAATAGATLDNRNGAAGTPGSAMLLADILVPGNSTSISAGNIRDRRPSLIDGHSGSIVNTTAQAITPRYAVPIMGRQSMPQATYTNYQSFAAIFVPTRVTFTYFRWSYYTSAAPGGNWNMALYDRSGRFITQAGSTAWANGFNSVANAASSGPLTIEPGWYWLGFGTTGSAAANINFMGTPSTTPDIQACASGPDQLYARTTGGVTLPTTSLQSLGLANANDPYFTSITTALSVPVISFSS